MYLKYTCIESGLSQRIEHNLKAFDLAGSDFDVLATLRRSGRPYELSPGALAQSTLLTSGTMTSRLDKLEKMGLLKRLPDKQDRRALRIALTPAGLKKTDAAVDAHVACQRALLDALDAKATKQLNQLLTSSR